MPQSFRFSPTVAICVGVLVASVLLPLPQGGAILNLPSPCPFFHLTGLPCPGCGLTRSFVCCGHGRIAEAFAWHPLGPLLFIAAILTALSPLVKRQFQPRNPVLWLIVVTGILGAFWVLRLGGVFPMPPGPDVVRLHGPSLT